MLTGYIRGQELRISTPEIAADSIKYLEAEFHFAGREWDGYVKTAYFINGASKFALVLADDRITADMGLNLTAGEWEVKLSGVKGGSRVTTTTEHIYVREFGNTDGTLPDVTATQAEQILAKIGDLSDLTTEDKTNLVAAINEAAKSGGSGGGKDGTGIESITYKGEDEAGGNVYTVLLTDGTSYDITAPKGDKGDKGDKGATGPQGPAGAPGKDGTSMDITGATVGQIAKITAVDASGVPTAWSPVDMPTGGGGEAINLSWKHIRDVELTPDIIEAIVSTTDAGAAFSYDEIMLEFIPNMEGYFYVRASQNALLSKNVSVWVTNSKYSQIHVGLLDKKLALTSLFRTDGSLGLSNNYGGNGDIDKISTIIFGASGSVGVAFTVKVWGR